MKARPRFSKSLIYPLIASAAWVAAPSRGAITPTGDVEPTSLATWTSSTVGYIAKASDGTLTVNAGSSLSAGTGYLGFGTGVTGTVQVSGSGSIWNVGNIYDGLSGTGTLAISSGAKVSGTTAYLGYNNGSMGTTSVDGAGTTWTAAIFAYIGNSGVGVLNITNGAKASTSASYLGFNANSSGTTTVSGTNSSWATTGLIIGDTGAGTLNVSNGGKVSSTTSYLGYNSNSFGTATIDGAGSGWTSSGLIIGNAGAGTLNLTNQATVTVSGITTIAGNTGGSGTINFGTTNGGTLSTQQLDASRSQVTGTGTIITRGLVGDGDTVFDSTHGASQTIVWNGTGQNVSVKLDLTGTSGTVGDLGAGYEGTGTLTFQNGVSIKSANGYLGYNGGSTGTATVNGTGSGWTTSTVLYIGYTGTGTLNITGGGKVTSSNSGYIGYNSGSIGTDTVNGSGSSWNLTSNLYVGSTGTGALELTAGGAVTDSIGYLGFNGGSSGTATVDGVGSSWTNSSDLYIGNSGSAALSITSGGKVTNNNGLVGALSGSTGNVTVDGSGSVWTNNNNLTVGGSGSGTVNITNSASVTVAGLTTVGSSGTINFGAHGGILTTSSLTAPRTQILGTGTINTRGLYDDGDLVFNAAHGAIATEIWSSAQQNVTVNLDLSGLNGPAGALGIGYQGTGTLAVLDGVTIHSSPGYLGYFAGSNGTATVSGSGSTWTDNGALYVGQSGSGQLNILSGGKVAVSSTSYLGYNSGAIGTVNVQGATASWSNGSNIYVGDNGSGSLNISNGAAVTSVNNTNNYNDIGLNKGSSGTVTVDGTGSKWTIVDGVNNGIDGLVVGSYGNGTLKITNGGVVNSSNSAYIAQWGASGTVTVDGPGSTWNNAFEIAIGYSGVGTLNITNGGVVNSSIYGANGGCSIGNNGGSSVVAVDGPGSLWNNNGFVDVGNGGNGTLNITNGGTVIMSGITNVASENGSSGGVGDGTGSGIGAINFGLNGGTLTTQGLYGSHSNITGTGTINARGVYYDGDLVFDSTHPLEQTQIWQGPQQNVTFNLDLSGQHGASGDLVVGYQTAGTLSIRDGLNVTTGYGYIAEKVGATGAATVEGPGSTWNYNNSMYVGLNGSGSLQILNGGTVNGIGTYGYIFLSSSSTASATATVDGAGSTWTVADLYECCIGYGSMATLNITNGGSLNLQSTESQSRCYIGNNGGLGGTGGSGHVTVNGIGSTLNFTDNNSSANQTLYVGFGGSELQITNGGNVICSNNNISYVDTSGIVTLDGAGSNWTAGKQLDVEGSGILTIDKAASVTAGSLTISNASSLLSINAGDGSILNVGTGSISNSGTIRIRAAGNAVAGKAYTPIAGGSWTGSGSVQAFGGTWNSSTHQFIASALAAGISGSPVTIDRSVTQRLVITDPATDNMVYADFLPTQSSSELTMTAAGLINAQESLLEPSLPSGSSLLDGWTFTTAGYTTGDPVFLSMAVGPGIDPSSLDLWHFDGTVWSAYSASDLTYDNAYANFTVTGFSGYAVSGVRAVPEPSSLSLLALTSMAVFTRRRRKN